MWPTPASVAVRTPWPAMSLPSTTTAPAPGVRSPVIASTSSCWPLPSTPASATISPARTDSDSPSTAARLAVVADVEVLDLAAAAPRASRPAPSRRAAARRGRPRAGPGCSSVAPSRGTVSILLPRRSTVIRSAISSTSLSLWLMKMIAVPSALRRWSTAISSLDLLRGEHGRGLVEDQDPGAPVQGAQDLDALLGADRDVLDRRIGIDGETVAVRQLAHAGPGGLRSRARRPPRWGSWPSTMFSATVITGTSMKCWWTIPMPSLIAAAGELDLDRPCRRRGSRLRSGLYEAVQDRHQRRLAGAVLTEQRVDLAGTNVEVDSVVGDDRAEPLRDALQLEHRSARARRHWAICHSNRVYGTVFGMLLSCPALISLSILAICGANFSPAGPILP